MSGWDAYTNKLIAGGCSGAAIYGLDNGAVWHKQGTLDITDAEVQSAIAHLRAGTEASLPATGLKCNNVKLMCLGCGGGVARAKKGDVGLVMQKTNRTVVVGHGGAGLRIPLETIGAAVGDLAGSLMDNQY